MPPQQREALSNPAGANRLSTVTPERWAEIRGEMPQILESIGPTVPNELAHLPVDAPPELIIAHLHRDGGVIIDNAVSEEVCDAVAREMEPYIQATADGKNGSPMTADTGEGLICGCVLCSAY